jgi:hypothetical protein
MGMRPLPSRGRLRLAVVGVAVVAVGVALVTIAAGGSGQALPTISIGNAKVAEGAKDPRLRFPVRLSEPSAVRVTVRFAVRAGTAKLGADYRATSGVFVLAAKQRAAFVDVIVLQDKQDEPNETLTVVLSKPTNAKLGNAVGVGTIVDDDAPGTDPVIAAAGDIACDPQSGSFNDGLGKENKCRQLATSDLLVGGRYAAVLTLGDNQYPDGEIEDFRKSFDPSWGRVKSIIRPTPGNHDYHIKGAAGYFDYFGAAAGERGKGWYSFNLGRWHLIALNSDCDEVPCSEGSEQERWLRADLAANKNRCVLAYWHHPRFSSGKQHGSNKKTRALFAALYEAGADVILAGHEHNYERLGPTDPDGNPDPVRGIRQFVVGNGGKNAGDYPFGDPLPTSEKRDTTSLGILELVLRPEGYDWRFIPAVGSFTDQGSDRCR